MAQHHHAPARSGASDHAELRQVHLLANAHLVMCGVSLLLLVLLVLMPMFMGPAYFQMMHIPMPIGGMAVIKEGLVPKLLNGGLQTLIFGLNGWSMRTRQNRISCIILSIFECLSLPPLGLVLGVLSVMLLRRETVKYLFDRSRIPLASR